MLKDDEQLRVAVPGERGTFAAKGTARRRVSAGIGERRWLLPLPGFILLALVTAPPFVVALVLSVFNIDNQANVPTRFIGLQNYATILTSARGLHAFGETLLISLECTALSLLVALAIALLIKNYTRRMSSWVLLLFLIPMTVSPVVAALNTSLLLNTLYGPVDEVLYSIFHVTIAWTDTPALATQTIVIVQIWQWSPLAILLLYSGLRSLPDEPLEAARVDGANRLATFWHISLPLLRPVLIVSVIFEFILASLQFTPTELLTQGGPGSATEAISLYVYHIGIAETGAVSQAAAAGVLMLIVTTIIATIWVRATRWSEGSGV